MFVTNNRSSCISIGEEGKYGILKGMSIPIVLREGMISMDTIWREKNRIQKREQTAQVALSLLLMVAFGVSAILPVSLARSPVVFIHTIFSTWWLPLSFGFLFFFIVGLGISQLGPFMQETQRQKQHWLNEYGRHILASVTRHLRENALVIGGQARGRGSSYLVYLDWQDPQTEQRYSFQVSTRFSSALRKLPEGTLYPVQFDPSDPAFFR
jgi:hypothetical protein